MCSLGKHFIDPLHKWRLNLSNNTVYILSIELVFPDKGFFYMNVRLRIYKYSYSNFRRHLCKGFILTLPLSIPV